MALKFQENKNTKMQQTTYIVYMMLASYYQKCICISKNLENQLFLYYKEMPSVKQVKKEEFVIHKLEQYLKPCLGKMENCNAKVKIQRCQDCYKLYFVSKEYSFIVWVNEEGQFTIAPLG